MAGRWSRFNGQSACHVPLACNRRRPPMALSSPPTASPSKAVRHLGRFQLLRLLGKSERTMQWLVSDPRVGQELVLVLPRTQLADAQAVQAWLDKARKAARIDHPGLAHPVEVGQHDRWPYVTYDRGTAVTLTEKLGLKGLQPLALVAGLVQVLGGLAFAHEAGLVHHDLQPSLLLLGDNGGCRLMGLGVALAPAGQAADAQSRRKASERDVLAFGLVLHHALVGSPALEMADVNQVIDHMAPQGREVVRLPRAGVGPIAEALRAIVNRATDRQERQRYRNARTFERALVGWLRADGEPGSGPLTLLVDRIRSAGLLPSMPGCQARAARLERMERQRTIELAEIVLQDVALSFELLRNVNGPRMRGALGGGNGPILTLRRAIAMVGLDGVRHASRVLKPWPGALVDGQVAEMTALLDRVQAAGRIAQALRPRGYDAELVLVLTLLQNLGRLVVQYHCPDELAQIRRLMLPAPAARLGDPEEPGMTEEAAAYAVLGVDIDSVAHALGRQWGLDEPTLLMIRRLPMQANVHLGEHDAELLRMTASCANEVVDARSGPLSQRAAGYQRVFARYGRALEISLQDILQAATGSAPDRADAPAADPGGSAVA